MSKQADGKLRKKVESLDIDFGYAVGNLGEDCKDNTVDKLMHLVEQRCLEARMNELGHVREVHGNYWTQTNINGDVVSVKERYVQLKAQLTNLQNKEDD